MTAFARSLKAPRRGQSHGLVSTSFSRLSPIRAFSSSLCPPSDAITAINVLLESPSVRLLSEVAGYWPVARSLLGGGTVMGARVHDARIAALCLTYGVDELWTADRDFSRFPQLRVRNPLA